MTLMREGDLVNEQEQQLPYKSSFFYLMDVHKTLLYGLVILQQIKEINVD